MNERQGFEHFCKRTNPKYRPTDDSVIDRASWRIWREACAWQRDQDCRAINAIDDGEAPEYRACQEAIREAANA